MTLLYGEIDQGDNCDSEQQADSHQREELAWEGMACVRVGQVQPSQFGHRQFGLFDGGLGDPPEVL